MPARFPAIRRTIPSAALALLLLAPSVARAFDFKSIGPRPVVLYDAPSLKGNKLYVAPSGMPVEVLVGYGDWVKVRDAAGDMAWARAADLSAKRNVIVRTTNAKVHAAPDDGSPVVMLVEKNVLLELVDPEAGTWLRVRHRDGQAGYIRAADVWGT
jgi:SH3-like domain-containing protein